MRIGTGILEQLVRELVDDPPAPRIVVVSDDTVAPLHAEPLARRLREGGLTVTLLSFPAGESGKTRDTKAALEDGLAVHLSEPCRVWMEFSNGETRSFDLSTGVIIVHGYDSDFILESAMDPVMLSPAPNRNR